VRTVGTIAAQRITLVQVPRISGQGGQMTLVKLVPNGSVVHVGDLVAEFDATAQIKSRRDAQAKFDDLSHQVEQKMAEDRSNAAKRVSDLAQANADLEKARLEIRKGPVLSDLDQLKNAEKLRDADEHVKSLGRSSQFHDVAERADVGVLVLQRDRQKLTLAQLQRDLDKLTVKAPIDGMVSLDNVWKNNSMGHAQEGDQLYAGNPLLRIFDPTSMVLQLSVNEADGAVLVPGSAAPKLVTRDMVKRMKPGSVMVDIAIDQGGCFETSRPTSHAQPTYVEHDVVHYCVTNMPGAVARTSTFALNNATLPFVMALAEKGWVKALKDDEHLRHGLNVCRGEVTYQAVAQDLGFDYRPAVEVLN